MTTTAICSVYHAVDQLAAATAEGDRPGRVVLHLPAARELGSLSLSESLALVLLYQRSGDDKFERAARRWVRRVQVNRSLRHREVELLRGALGALGTRFDAICPGCPCLGHVENCDYRRLRGRRTLPR